MYIYNYIYIETKYVCVYDIELKVLNTHNIKSKLDYPSFILIFIVAQLGTHADEA